MSARVRLSPANTRRCPDVGPTLGHRLRRWPSIGPTSGQRLVFAGRPRITKKHVFFAKPREAHALDSCRFPKKQSISEDEKNIYLAMFFFLIFRRHHDLF